MTQHPIVHVELSSQDRERDGQFYHDLLGWEIRQIPEMNYATFSWGEPNIGGGLNPINEDNPAGTIIVYIDTDDIDEALQKVQALGGEQLSEKHEIPGVGWFALFSDPSGNRMALLQPLPRT